MHTGRAESGQSSARALTIYDFKVRVAEIRSGTRSPRDASDHVALAHSYESGEDGALRSAEHYALAAADEGGWAFLREMRLLYFAARQAALAYAAADVRDATEHRANALAWLRAHLLDRMADLDEAHRRGATEEELETLRSRLVRHYRSGRERDPAFAPLRGTDAFDALFAGIRLPEVEGGADGR